MSKEADAKEALKYAQCIIEELIKHLVQYFEKHKISDDNLLKIEEEIKKLKKGEKNA